MLNSHEGAIARPKQELGIHERVEQFATRRSIESPQPSRLRLGQAQPRHFEELTLHSSNNVVSSADVVRGHLQVSSESKTFGNGHNGSNRHATGIHEHLASRRTRSSAKIRLIREYGGRRVRERTYAQHVSTLHRGQRV
jgi:hypothetical protein